MKQKLPVFATSLVLAALLWTACNKPSPFGSELLAEELADIEFTDTLSVLFTVQREDSLLTSDPSSTSAAFLCGTLDDPHFGKSEAEIFSLLQLSFLDPGFKPDSQTVDSIVLFLRYAPASFYGDSIKAQTLRVFRLKDPLDDEGDYYAHNTIAEDVEIGRLENFYPKPNTADSLFSPDSKAPYIRIPLNIDFGNEIFRMDTSILQNDSAFYQALRGIKITASSNEAPGAMLAFNLNNTTYSRVRLYYSGLGNDTVSKSYDLYFAGCNKFTHFEHEYANAPAGLQIDQVSDQLLYLQAMQGLRLKVEFPYADVLDNIAVNKAQLVLTTATVPNDYPVLTPAQQLIFTERTNDTTVVFTSDVLYSIGSAGNLGFSRFGGFPEDEIINGTLVERYRLNLSDRFQAMVDDTSNDIKNKTLYINITPQSRLAQRLILYGPKNTTYPAKLELKYTRVQ